MIAIIQDTGTNFSSLQGALKRLGYHSVVSSEPVIIQNASHVILPGVGHANHAMQKLKTSGLDQLIPTLKQPVLGICLGMQLLFEYLEEGETEGLKLIPGLVQILPKIPGVTIPHMGWNQLKLIQPQSPLLNQVPSQSYVYFIHGYAAPQSDYSITLTEHGILFSSIVQYRNFFGMQFHPEKSGPLGAQLLSNFLKLSKSV